MWVVLELSDDDDNKQSSVTGNCYWVSVREHGQGPGWVGGIGVCGGAGDKGNKADWFVSLFVGVVAWSGLPMLGSGMARMTSGLFS